MTTSSFTFIFLDSDNVLWPKLEDFKDMLRKESEVRLDILGPWARNVVREEAGWRLDLYKNWLQLLADGIGDPIFDGDVEYPWDAEINYDEYVYADDEYWRSEGEGGGRRRSYDERPMERSQYDERRGRRGEEEEVRGRSNSNGGGGNAVANDAVKRRRSRPPQQAGSSRKKGPRKRKEQTAKNNTT